MYSVTVEQDRKLFEAKISVSGNKKNRLTRNDFKPVKREITDARGFTDADSKENRGKKRVAVLDFSAKNTPKEYAEITRDFFEINLHKKNVFVIIERSQMDLLLKEQGLQMTGCTDTSCAIEIGRILTADYVILGSLSKIADYMISVRLIDITRGNILLADAEKANTEKQIEKAVEKLADKLADDIKTDVKKEGKDKPGNEKPVIAADNAAGNVKDQPQNKNRTSTFIKDVRFYSGYGAPAVKFTKFGEHSNLLVGCKGGWIIDRIVIGVAGYGSADTINMNIDSAEKKFRVGYGGLLFEYYFFPKRLFNFSFGVILAAGGINPQQPNESTDGFFIIEPEFNMSMNITRFFRIGAGLSKRYMQGVDMPWFSAEGYDKYRDSITMFFAFGWF